MSKHAKQVFVDPSGRRSRLVDRLLLVALIVLAVVVFAVVQGTVWSPQLPELTRTLEPDDMQAQQARERHSASVEHGYNLASRRSLPSTAENVKRLAFFSADLFNGLVSLRRHAHDLDGFIPQWLGLKSTDGRISQDNHQLEGEIRRWMDRSAKHLQVYPAIGSSLTDIEMARLLAEPTSRARLIGEIDHYLDQASYQGITIAFDSLSASNGIHLVTFVRELREKLASQGRIVILRVGSSIPTQLYPALGQEANYLLVNTHDATAWNNMPGPIAGQGWFENRVKLLHGSVDRSKLIFTIGSFGYDWLNGVSPREITVQEAWSKAEEAKIKPKFDAHSLNSHFRYTDGNGIEHDVWFLDGVSVYNHLRTAMAEAPAAVALWQLGSEDQSLWQAFARKRLPDERVLVGLETLPTVGVEQRADYPVTFTSTPRLPGRRTVAYDDRIGLITEQSIEKLPSALGLQPMQFSGEKTLALTFDDGPDPKYTGKVLDILARENIKASFFFVGKYALANPELFRRVYAEGHDLGSHSYSHIDMFTAEQWENRFELNAAQRVSESLIGVRTLFFRAPYTSQNFLKMAGAAELLQTSSELGYVYANLDVDPHDWALQPAEAIENKVVADVLAGRGRVILLHDGGGNRDAMLKALPNIVKRLKENGYRFIALHELLGKTRADFMPPVSTLNTLSYMLTEMRTFGMLTMSWLGSVLPPLAIGATLLGILRLLLIIVAAYAHRRRERDREALDHVPDRVAVLVPGYNEEKVICETVESLLQSTGIAFDIIVIDDGSKDRTAEVVRERYAGNDRVKVFRKENGGKAAALNFGLLKTDAEVVVAIDADTILAPDAVALLVRHFVDPSVGAVAGSAKVGNEINFITKFQSLEYITSQNFDRRAFELCNAIGVVPGAIGAWRREAVLRAGGYSTDTLAEDADLTIAVQRLGLRVIYEPKAFAMTEAPEKTAAFLKQRFRWMFGTLQVAYKHFGAVLQMKPAGIGLVTIPNIILFQFAFTLMAPVMDVLLVQSLYAGISDWMGEGLNRGGESLLLLAKFWVLFQLLDFVAAFVAVRLSGEMSGLKLIPLLVIQRFTYRQLLYFTAIRTLLAATKGQLVGWGKLLRTGSVKLKGLSQNTA